MSRRKDIAALLREQVEISPLPSGQYLAEIPGPRSFHWWNVDTSAQRACAGLRRVIETEIANGQPQ
jgi:hypothetical protein